jgi:hypothetical protein
MFLTGLHSLLHAAIFDQQITSDNNHNVYAYLYIYIQVNRLKHKVWHNHN